VAETLETIRDPAFRDSLPGRPAVVADAGGIGPTRTLLQHLEAAKGS
jgi:hypothetical protein